MPIHFLPFGAKMTEKLFRMAEQPRGFPPTAGDCVPSIVWAPQSFAVSGKAGWLLCWIPRSDAEPERLFRVDEVTLHISAQVEPLLDGQIFDWDDNTGIVSHPA